MVQAIRAIGGDIQFEDRCRCREVSTISTARPIVDVRSSFPVLGCIDRDIHEFFQPIRLIFIINRFKTVPETGNRSGSTTGCRRCCTSACGTARCRSRRQSRCTSPRRNSQIENTLGFTIPDPITSIQPLCLHTRHPDRSQKMQDKSTSALGSVNGKKLGLKRVSVFSPKNCL